jgi:hypothetical protein
VPPQVSLLLQHALPTQAQEQHQNTSHLQ